VSRTLCRRRSVGSRRDELALLELVQQADELAAVVAERVRDRALRLARPLVEDGEDGVVVGMETGLLVRRHGLILELEAEPLHQERRRRGQLLGQAGALRQGGGLDVRGAHGRKSSALKRWSAIKLRMSTIRKDN
jgi:hypothetical protein